MEEEEEEQFLEMLALCTPTLNTMHIDTIAVGHQGKSAAGAVRGGEVEGGWARDGASVVSADVVVIRFGLLY